MLPKYRVFGVLKIFEKEIGWMIILDLKEGPGPQRGIREKNQVAEGLEGERYVIWRMMIGSFLWTTRDHIYIAKS